MGRYKGIAKLSGNVRGYGLLLICVLGLTYTSFAQAKQASWSLLNGLQVGQSIQVVDSSSKKHSGTFMSVSDTAISLQVASGEQSIQRQDIRSVKLMANKRRARNTLVGGAVGGGIGAGVGAIIGAATHRGCTSGTFCLDIVGTSGSAGIGAAVGFLGGVTAGGVVGALVPSHTKIYEARSH
jgi:hypothetical protein